MFQGDLACRRYTRVTVREPRRFLADMKLLEAFAGIDQEIARGLEALEYVRRLEQGRILNNQAVRLQDRLAQPDLLVGNAAEGNDGRAGALGTEARKRLRMLAFKKCCD